MWLVTKIGFFNIIQYPEDRKVGMLTVKARRQDDLIRFRAYLDQSAVIEESKTADYRFRLKAPLADVIVTVAKLVSQIDYDKTKPAVSMDDPIRADIYLETWDVLSQLQTTENDDAQETTVKAR